MVTERRKKESGTGRACLPLSYIVYKKIGHAGAVVECEFIYQDNCITICSPIYSCKHMKLIILYCWKHWKNIDSWKTYLIRQVGEGVPHLPEKKKVSVGTFSTFRHPLASIRGACARANTLPKTFNILSTGHRECTSSCAPYLKFRPNFEQSPCRNADLLGGVDRPQRNL